MRQKSKESWLKHGDKSTKFFHSVVKAKYARNHISHLITESGVFVSNPATLKKVAPAFYQKLFNHNGYWNVFPRVVARKKLTVNAALWLESCHE